MKLFKRKPKRPWKPAWSVHMVGSKTHREHFERLQADTGESTVDLFRSALALYRYVVDIDKAGGTLVIVDRDGYSRTFDMDGVRGRATRPFTLIDGDKPDDA